MPGDRNHCSRAAIRIQFAEVPVCRQAFSSQSTPEYPLNLQIMVIVDVFSFCRSRVVWAVRVCPCIQRHQSDIRSLSTRTTKHLFSNESYTLLLTLVEGESIASYRSTGAYTLSHRCKLPSGSQQLERYRYGVVTAPISI
jgi:hypothetical protein